MGYSVVGRAASGSLGRFAGFLTDALERAGFERGAEPYRADLVLNLVDPERPQRRVKDDLGRQRGAVE